MSTKKQPKKDDLSDLEIQIQRLTQADDYLISDIDPSDWAEAHRVMGTEDTAFPGPFSYERTPYLREVVNCLRPDHPAKKIAVMKASQVGFSTGVIENGIGWLIDESPCPILLAARDEDLVKDMMTKKIDGMIDSCGLRSKIRPNILRARNQRTGDTDKGKEFAGGSLRAYSIQKPGRMRQISVQVGFLDDFEAAPVDKKSGSAAKLFETRFDSYYDKMKIFYISTPEVKQTSNIEPLFQHGDQRKYFVPCPCCGDYITLEWRVKSTSGKKAGISYELDENKELVDGSVGYICQSCDEFFTDGHKYEMNLAGEWRPTVVQKDETFFSYHLNSLYAPPGMYDWEYYVKEYLDCCPPEGRIKIDDYKVFINTCLGFTWEERGLTPSVNRLALNTRPYPIGVIPVGLSEDDGNGEIVMITCACDLNGIIEDARLDYEIVAWSESSSSYSIDHGSIGTFVPLEKHMKNPKPRDHWSYEHSVKNSVWPEFFKIITKEYKSDDDVRAFKIMITGIDTGHYTQQAYQFVSDCNEAGVFTVGLKGDKIQTFKRLGSSLKIYKKSREKSDLYLLEVNQIKDELAATINLPWSEGSDALQPNEFMNFPTPSDNKYTMKSYFSQYESEHKIMKVDAHGKETGYLWEKKNMKVMNHFWDVKVYNMAIRELLMDMICAEGEIKDSNWHAYCRLITGR